MPPHYPWCTQTVARIIYSIFTQEQRSIHADARALANRLSPPLRILGHENIPDRGPCVITVNHYSRPGFPSWWIALAVSAAVPVDIHWIMTQAWTYPTNPLKQRTITPLTRWVFTRIARVYGFTTMPPMPPNPHETIERAHGVRHALAYARHTPDAIIGLAPEGGDMGRGALTRPPPGAGRFMTHLASLGLAFIPVGVYEFAESLTVQFGTRYTLSVSPTLSPEARDRQASEIVMQAIANVLPTHLRGVYGGGGIEHERNL